MKKNLLVGIIGLSALALFTTNVNAETIDLENVSETGKSVIVGEVDVPVYSVDITWGDLTYDWKYDDVTKEYYWREQINCEKLYNDEYETLKHGYENRNLNLYWDDNCETELSYGVYDFETAISQNVYYSQDKGGGTISIVDNSANGEIVPSVSWTSEDKYNFVQGKFQYEGPFIYACDEIMDASELEYLIDNGREIYTDSSCTLKSTDAELTFEEGKYYYPAAGGTGFKDLQTNVLPDEARLQGAGNGSNIGNYYLKLSLINDESKEVKPPVTGDKIGTVTISIDAK